MISDQEIKKITIELMRASFYEYFSKPKNETKHILLDRLFPIERHTASKMSGLQTSLGRAWEKLVKKFAVLNGFTVIPNFNLQRPTSSPEELRNLIIEVKNFRENQGGDLSLLRTRLDELYSNPDAAEQSFIPMIKGKGADVILEKDGHIYIYDTKTVQINANNGNSLNETIIQWIAYWKFQSRIPAERIHAYIAFPYNSSNEADDRGLWDEFRRRLSPLTQEEILIGNAFWHQITGNPGALVAMISGFDELASDQNFTDLYSRAFQRMDEEQTKRFVFDVKVNYVQFRRNVLLAASPHRRNAQILAWMHGNDDNRCEFPGRISALLQAEFLCPTCNQNLEHSPAPVR